MTLIEAFFVVAVLSPNGTIDSAVHTADITPAECAKAVVGFHYNGPLFVGPDDEGTRVVRFVNCGGKP